MTLVVTLVLVGVVLLAAEVIVPGAILGIAGGLFMLGGVIAAFVQFGAGAGAVTLAIALLLVGLAVFLEFKVLPRSRVAKAFSMTATVQGAATEPAGAELVGRECVAATKLMPSGMVRVDDRRHEAFSRSGACEAGERLRIVGIDNFRLIVTKIESSS